MREPSKQTLHIHHFDHQTALHALLARQHQQPWARLLETAGPQGADNRFDIITADPLATLQQAGRALGREGGADRLALAGADRHDARRARVREERGQAGYV